MRNINLKAFVSPLVDIRESAGELRTMLRDSGGKERSCLVNQFALRLIAVAIQIDEAVDEIEENLKALHKPKG